MHLTRESDEQNTDRLLRLVLEVLNEGQADDIVSIPLAGKSPIADHMVVASGRSTRQIAALAQRIDTALKKELGMNVRIEGLQSADWVLIDAQDVIVHIFRPEVRAFYALEKMWTLDVRPPADTAEGGKDGGQ